MSKEKRSGSGKQEGSGRSPSRKAKQGAAAAASAPAGSAPAASAQKRRLEGELIEAIGQLDEEGLLFLLQQAQILVHNAQVDRINREMQELQERRSRSGGRGKGAPASPAERAGAEQPAAGRAAVRIDEADNRKSFFLDFAGVRKALSLQEMQRVVKICYSAESKSAALRQLYTVFSRERGDILADARIGGASSPLLEALFYAVREKYRLEER